MKNSTLFKKSMLLFAMGLFGFSYSSAAVQADTTTILSETFMTGLGEFTPQSLVGTQVWYSSSYGGVGFAKISGYSSGNKNNEDWLVSPAVDLSNASGALLSFGNCHKFGVNPTTNLTLMISDSYTSGPIDTTQWVSYPFTYGTGLDYNFVNSGDISLAAFEGKPNVHFAFRYKSDSLTSAATWEVNNATVRGIVTQVIPQTIVFSENFDKVTSNTTASPGTSDITPTIDNYTVAPGWSGIKIYQAGGGVKMGSSSVPGIITTPAIDLSAQSGAFKISFKSLTWSGDTTHLQIYVDDVLAKEITGLNNDANYTYGVFGPYELTGGTAASKIKFTTSKAASKNCRFYLDSLVITQVASITPSAQLATIPFKTKAGTSKSQNLTLTGMYLTGDLTVALTNTVGTAFSTQVTTVAKADAMAGYSVPVVYQPAAAGADTATITISGGGLAQSVTATVAGSAFATVVVPNLGALRDEYVADPSTTTIYELTGEVTVANVQTSGNSKYVQDATGGILIYDTQGNITTTFVAGNGMTGLMGTLTEYGKQLEFIPMYDATVSTVSKDLFPVMLTIAQAKDQKERFESMYVYFENLTYINATAVPNWGTSKSNFKFVNGLDTIICRTNYTGMDYMTATTAIPTTPTNFAGMLLEYNGTLQFFPRSLTDIGYTGTVLGLTETSVPASVWGSNGTLNVNAAQGQTIEVFNLMGQRLMKSIANEGVNTFSLGKSQLYLVKVNNRVSKIVL